MGLYQHLVACLILLTSLVGLAETQPAMPLALFSADKDPGKGQLTYTNKGRPETIVFGAATGYYGLGIVFKGSQLPSPLNKEFSNRLIFQLIFGNAKAAQQQVVAQFGTASIITDLIPTKARVYPFRFGVPEKEAKSFHAMLFFTSPTTTAIGTAEDRLKDTFFGTLGNLTVKPPASEPKDVFVDSHGQSWGFKTQKMEFQIDGLLTTPFTEQKNALRGVIECPVYWPSGPKSEALISSIAADSLLGKSGPIARPEGLQHHSRGVAGSSKNRK